MMMRTGFLLIFLVIVIVFISNGYSKSSTTSAEWKTYTDINDKFTIDYPTDWNIEPRENRFDTKDVIFSLPDEGNSVNLGIVTTETPTKLDIEEYGKDIITERTSTRDNFRLIDSWECEKYSINNATTCSLVFTTGTSPFESAEMDVYTVHNTTTYTIVYRTIPDLFDKHLPTVDQMIKSINYTK
jgi:hypothetical protein